MPVDAEAVFARLKETFRRLLKERCGDTAANCVDLSVFLASNDRSRVPGAFELMRAANHTLTHLIASIAPYCDVRNGSCDSEEECIAQMANETCVRSLEHARMEEFQLEMRWWYSLKRERAFLDRLLAACQLQGGVFCVDGVNVEIAAHDAAIVAARPSLRESWREMFLTGSVINGQSL